MFMTCFPLVFFFDSLFFYFDRNIIHENRFVKTFSLVQSVIQHNMYNVHSVSFLFSCNILCHSQFLHRLKFSTSAKLFKKGNIQFTCRYNKVCSFFLRRVELFGFFGMGWGGKTNYIWSTQVSKKTSKRNYYRSAMHGVEIFSSFRFCSPSIIYTGHTDTYASLLCARWSTLMNDDERWCIRYNWTVPSFLLWIWVKQIGLNEYT